MKPISLTVHANQVLSERHIDTAWVSQTTAQPDWRDADPSGAERRFKAIPERDGRILRVVCIETDNEVRVITAFFDRNARSPR